MDLELSVRRLRDGARPPSYATSGSAGLDLYACLEEPLDLDAGSITLIPTGVALAIPPGHVGLVRDRSGMARKGVTTVAGVIDCDYRGELMIAVHNVSAETRRIEHGDRVAQMLVLPCPQVSVQEVRDLPASERGTGGFGSTGR